VDIEPFTPELVWPNNKTNATAPPCDHNAFSDSYLNIKETSTEREKLFNETYVLKRATFIIS